MGDHATESQLAQGLKGQPRGIELLRVEARAGALMDPSALGWAGTMSSLPWVEKIRNREIESDEQIVPLLRQMHLLGLRTGLTVPMSPDQLRKNRDAASDELNVAAREQMHQLLRTGTLEATDAERRASADGVAELVDFFLVAPQEPAEWLGYAWANGIFLAMRARGAGGAAN
jgi:hypothetical protein